MKVFDPLAWAQPEAISEWGDRVIPPLENAWFDYLNYYVHPDVVVAVSRLLIPAFVEHEGGVFLADKFSINSYADWKEKLRKMSEIEKVINHQHVYDIFSLQDDIPEASYLGVAQLMSQTIKLALNNSFPERDFSVYVSNTDRDYGPTVVFHSLFPAVGSPPVI